MKNVRATNETKNQLIAVYGYTNELTPEHEEYLIRRHTLFELKKGEQIIAKDVPADSYYIVVDGYMRSHLIDINGKDVTTRFFQPNQVALEFSSFFQQRKAKESITALTNCLCWKIEHSAFLELFHELPNFSNWGRNWMVNALLKDRDQSLSVYTHTAKERYIAFEKNNKTLAYSVPLKHIASFLRITDSTLSRIRKDLIQDKKY